jgi:hypothetical protein
MIGTQPAIVGDLHGEPPFAAHDEREARFARLFTDAERDILAYALRRVARPEDAADIVAETFLVAWRRLEDVPAGDGARLWLYGVARRQLDVAAFEVLLASLRAVDTDTWLSALPASVVKTTDRTAVIASMLQGVTLPPGFDAASITGAGLTSDRYQLGATVAGTVACTWFKLWSDARRSGDAAGVQRAIDAMATAKDWPILKEMSSSGGYPQILEAFAAAMPSGLWSGRPLEGDVDSGLGCPALGIPLTPGGQPMQP